MNTALTIQYYKKSTLCREKIFKPQKIITKNEINIGYGPGQLKPNGARDLRAEENITAKLIMQINGMSGNAF